MRPRQRVLGQYTAGETWNLSDISRHNRHLSTEVFAFTHSIRLTILTIDFNRTAPKSAYHLMTKILAINGSYRDDGMTDQAITAIVQAAKDAGASVEVLLLRDYPIEFCLNCRECTQQPGEQPGHCIQNDAMNELVARIEEADAYILASPTNFGSVTALFKRFMERLAVYAYWPWGAHAPKYRKSKAVKKKAVLIASSAAPGFIARWTFGTVKQLKMTASTIGARPVGILFTGLASGQPHPVLPEASRRKAQRLAKQLL